MTQKFHKVKFWSFFSVFWKFMICAPPIFDFSDITKGLLRHIPIEFEQFFPWYSKFDSFSTSAPCGKKYMRFLAFFTNKKVMKKVSTWIIFKVKVSFHLDFLARMAKSALNCNLHGQKNFKAVAPYWRRKNTRLEMDSKCPSGLELFKSGRVFDLNWY